MVSAAGLSGFPSKMKFAAVRNALRYEAIRSALDFAPFPKSFELEISRSIEGGAASLCTTIAMEQGPSSAGENSTCIRWPE